MSGVRLGARVRVVGPCPLTVDRPYIGREGKAVRFARSSFERGWDCFWVRFEDGEERTFERRELAPVGEALRQYPEGLVIG